MDWAQRVAEQIMQLKVPPKTKDPAKLLEDAIAEALRRAEKRGADSIPQCQHGSTLRAPNGSVTCAYCGQGVVYTHHLERGK